MKLRWLKKEGGLPGGKTYWNYTLQYFEEDNFGRQTHNGKPDGIQGQWKTVPVFQWLPGNKCWRKEWGVNFKKFDDY